MKPLLTIALLAILFGCSQPTTQTEQDQPDAFEANRDLAGDESYDAAERIGRMQGTWIHTEDSTAIVEINEAEWVFKSVGSESETPDKYTITVIDSLPQLVGVGVRGDYLILSSEQDTMHYEIEGIGPEYMTLNYLARGISHTYRKSN